MRHAPTIAERGVQAPLAVREVPRKNDDHEDLGDLAELELEPEDRDPAGGDRIGASERERGREERQVHEVDGPGERLQPRVVEGRRGREGNQGNHRPDDPADEGGPTLQRLAAQLGGRVAVRHRQPQRGEEHGVDKELQVEVAPGDAADAGGNAGGSVALNAEDAHQRPPV